MNKLILFILSLVLSGCWVVPYNVGGIFKKSESSKATRYTVMRVVDESALGMIAVDAKAQEGDDILYMYFHNKDPKSFHEGQVVKVFFPEEVATKPGDDILIQGAIPESQPTTQEASK